MMLCCTELYEVPNADVRGGGQGRCVLRDGDQHQVAETYGHRMRAAAMGPVRAGARVLCC